MSKEAKINSFILDKAIVFAVHAHKNVERRGKGFPYIAHPLEAMAIVASMTNDQELLAAACLHDVIEDTDITYEDLRREFGPRVADLVLAESDKVIPNKDASSSWVERKQAAIDHLASSPREVQMVALGDKLSNMRALYRDYKMIGDELWNRFHVSDPRLHAWHYRGLAASLSPLKDTDAYKEFVYLVDKTFGDKYVDFSYKKEGDVVYCYGEVDSKAIDELKKSLDISTSYTFDFSNVFNVNFSGIRSLMVMVHEGYHFYIRNVNPKVGQRFEVTGAATVVTITNIAKEYTKFSSLEQSGEGYTALTYWTQDQDAMIKIYHPGFEAEAEKEKRYSTAAMNLGIPTPLSGEILEIEGKRGLIFERIKDKVSFARAIANDPSRIEELAIDFARMAKKLHATKCDTNVFPNAKEKYRNTLLKFAYLSQEEKDKVLAFINSIPDVDTCLHGDFHFGNVIITKDNEKLFIDMADFSYGHPYIDLGTLWYMSHIVPEERAQNMFHTSKDNLLKFYQYFIKEYFDNKLSEQEADKLLAPYGALTVLFFASKDEGKEWMSFVLKDLIIGR